MKKVRRLTLVELLAVMALVTLLGGIGFGSYSYAKGQINEAATKSLFKHLEAGLEGFRVKTGGYPASGGEFKPIRITLDDTGRIDGLSFNGSAAGDAPQYGFPDADTTREGRIKKEHYGAFVKQLDAEMLKKHLNASGEIVDAWGGKIYYCCPGKFNTNGYDLVSAGQDGAFGAVASGEEPKEDPNKVKDAEGAPDRTKFRTEEGEAVCDDIFNF